jgi:type IV secretion system protein VirB10
MSASDATDPSAPEIAIRARPPSPKRLSRKVLLAGTIIAGAVIAFALVSGLSDRPDRRAAETEAVASAAGPPESIAQASSQYEARLLPRGALEADATDFETLDQGGELAPPSDPLWANSAPPPSAPQGPSAGETQDPEALARIAPIVFASQASGAASMRARDDGEANLDAALTPPRSRYAIQAGHVIPAALVTGLNSDLPGRVIAQVTAPVFDSVTGDYLLIPQGSRLIGTYDNGVAYGDRRLLLVWNRLIFPNGWSINLREMSATDPSGASGLRDRSDHHLDRLAAAIGLSAIISVIANESEDDEDRGSLAQSVGDAAAQQAAQTGGRIVDRELSVRPSLTVRPGASVRVLVVRDIQLRPYRS